MRRFLLPLLTAVLGLFACSEASSTRSTHIAVATNFVPVMSDLSALFERSTDYELIITAGSTGKLFAQVQQGAPFDLFLSADQARPEQLERDGTGVAGTRFTYARGRLTLWRMSGEPVDAASLNQADLRHVAIANPALAPYGIAARETLEAIGAYDALKDRLVLGENVGQAFTFVKTGNAELGLVARAQVLALPEARRGVYWHVPDELHGPIYQDAVLLQHGADNPGARAFVGFLQSAQAIAIIERAGYKSE